MYGEDSAETAMLRYFKETILSRTPEGRELIRIFYFWNPLLIKAIEEDEAFREEIKEMIDEMFLVTKQTEE
jgi:hypothetical protein